MLLRKNWVFKLYLFIGFTILGYIFLSAVISDNDLSLFKSEIKSLNNDWVYKTSLEEKYVNLPEDIEIPKEESSIIYKELSQSFKSEQTLLIRSSLSDIKVMLGATEIYTNTYEKNGLLRQPYASAWHLITIPRNSNGETLRIELFSPFKAMHGTLNPIIYGNRGDLILYLLKENASIVITDLIIFFLGFLLVLFSFAFSGKSKQSILAIGLFSVILSFWMLTETKMLQFFTGNPMIIGGIAYISLSLAGIPLIVYIKSVLRADDKILNFFITAFLIDSLSIIVLQLMDIKYFFETMIVTHTIIGLLIAYIFYISYKSISESEENNVKHFVLGIMVFMIFCSIELIRFYILGLKTASLVVRIGIILFILINGYGSIKEYINHIEKSYKSEIYKELAYMDSLTGSMNRMAFQNEIEYLFKNKILLKDLCFIIFDLNDLKKINDEFGHVFGDRGIKTAYKYIEEYFSEFGNCYRIGGDEFACLLKITDRESFKERVKEFKKTIKEKDMTFDFSFNIASGYVFYNPMKDHSPKDFIHRGDQKMYQDKYTQKRLTII